MSSGGQVAGGVIGAVAGFFIGGPAAGLKGALYGAQIGIAVGGYLDPPKGPVQQGPRLADLTVQTSTYGAFIPRGYGTFPVTGNVFWLENNQLTETINEESTGGGKGGGSSTTTETFSYSATFAIGLLDCSDGVPITGIRRIWISKKPFADYGSTELSAVLASNNASQFFTLHKGEIDQAPDERMQATLGIANTPAYRGLAYIVFKDLPLAPYGNSLVGAQVTVEIVREGNFDVFPLISEYTSPTVDRPGWAYTHSPGYLSIEHVRFWMPEWDSYYPTTSTYTIYDYRLESDEVSPPYTLATPTPMVPPRMLSDNPDRVWWTTNPQFPLNGYTAGFSSITEVGDLIFGSGSNGLELLVGNSSGPTITVPTVSKVLPNLTRVGTTDGEYCYTAEDGGAYDTWFRKYDTALNEIASYYLPTTLSGVATQVDNQSILTVYEGQLYYFKQPQANGCAVFTIDVNFLTPMVFVGYMPNINFSGSYWNQYLKIIDGVIVIAWPNNINKNHVVRYVSLKNINVDGVPLSSIVQAECLKSSLLTSGDIDTSLLTQLVRGYRIGSVAAIRAGLEPPQGAWPFDVIQHGYMIKFKPRGSSSVATIPASDLDARQGGAAPGVALTTSREMDSVLPQRVTLDYMDIWRAYDAGQQYAERLNTASVNIRALDLAIVLNADEAAGIVETLLYLYWLERYDVSFSLPPTYGALEPADVITLNTDDASYSLRLTGVTYTQDGRLECSAKYNNAAIYVPAAIGIPGPAATGTFITPGDSVIELLDVPLLDDSHNNPGFPAAMTGYLSGWPGGIIFRSDDLGQTWTTLQNFLPPRSVLGVAHNVIGAPLSPLIDKASLLSVTLKSGSLYSVSELSMLNGANHFAYGAHGRWEIIAAQNCMLESDGSYTLYDLLRGRQGTEWASGLHAVGDKIVLLDSALAFISTSSSSIGLSRNYRGVTLGKVISSASDYPFTYSGVNLECLSPVYLGGSRHPTTNDWTLTWIRRTRIGGEWRDYVDATLGEAALLYDVEVYSSNTYTTLKRTFFSLTSEAATYSSAQQGADFTSIQPTLYVKVYQISATVGRGYPLVGRVADPTADPYWDSVRFACHMDGTTTSFVDPKGFVLTAVGTVTQSATQSKFGGKSAYIGVATQNNGLKVGTSAGSALLHAGDFTHECWFYQTADSELNLSGLISRCDITQPASYASSTMAMVVRNASGTFYPDIFSFCTSTGSYPMTGTIATALNTWNHVEFSRSGNTIRLFVNGKLSVSRTVSGVSNGSNYSQPLIGAIDQSGGLRTSFNGYIDEVRSTDGVCRHNYEFDVPTTPYKDY